MSAKKLVIASTNIRRRRRRPVNNRQAIENRLRAIDASLEALADRVQLYLEDKDAIGIQTLVEDRDMVGHAQKQTHRLRALLGMYDERGK